MPRAHLALLILGVALILLATLRDEDVGPAVPASMPAGEAGLGEPDLVMEDAEISQFTVDGALRYRINAARIVHYPDASHTLLTAPDLTLYRPGEAPWEVRADRGRIVGGETLLEAPSTDADAAAGPEIVHLTDSVVLRRQRARRGFVELSTDRLTLHPQRQFAETDAPVTIDTDAGRTTATGLTADLATGRLSLDADPSRRVRTTLFPDTLR